MSTEACRIKLDRITKRNEICLALTVDGNLYYYYQVQSINPKQKHMDGKFSILL